MDLAVWDGRRPADDDEARATFESLCERFLDAARVPPNPKIAQYVSELLARYPDLPVDDGEADDVPWGSGPLPGNASGPIVYIDMKLNNVLEDGWRYSVETAILHGLVAFDPQSGTPASLEATRALAVWAPTGRRGGPVYRWVSMHSWRWPFLRPLLGLLRRSL